MSTLLEEEELPEVEETPPVVDWNDELLSLCEETPENWPWKFPPATVPVVSTVYCGPWVRVAEKDVAGELGPYSIAMAC